MAQFKKGDAVQQVLPAPVAGTVDGFAVDQETGALLVLVSWSDAGGHKHSRHFSADQLQAAL